MVQALNGDCHSPIAALGEITDGTLSLQVAAAAVRVPPSSKIDHLRHHPHRSRRRLPKSLFTPKLATCSAPSQPPPT